MGFWANSFFAAQFWHPGFWAGSQIPVDVADTHDGGNRTKKRLEEYIRRQQELRDDLLAAVRKADGILDIEPEVLEIKQAIPQAFTKVDVARIAAEVREIYLRIEAKQRMDEDDDEAVLLLLNG